MTLAVRRTFVSPSLSSTSRWALGLLGSLFLAYWWAREFAPAAVPTVFGAYFLAPSGWLLPAIVGYGLVRRLPQNVPVLPEGVTQRTVVTVAALVGVFIVALQVIVAMVADFGKSPFNHSPEWLFMNAIFAGAPLLAGEAARNAFLRYGKMRSLTLALVLTSLGIALLQFGVNQFNPEGFKEKSEFWGGAYLPAASLGLLAGFFALYGGFRAAFLVSLPTTAFTFLSPILPVADWPILALVGVAGPAMGLWMAESLFEPADEAAEEKNGRFSLPSVAWVMTAVFGLVIFWFSFGFFGYLPAFVPSHSMEPLVKQGDIVLTKNIKPDQVVVGDIILYQAPGRQRVLHRVIDIQTGENGERNFIMKGDNNNAQDPRPIVDEQVKSKYIGRVPKAGWVPIKFQQGLQALR